MSIHPITRGRQARHTAATMKLEVCRRFVLGLVLAAGTLMGAGPAGAASDAARANLEQWLLRRLNDPTARERAHERKGNVYIYDALTDRDVDLALNRHFERIEYMMFVGTRRTDPNGTAPGDGETESPGCGP